MEQFIVSPEIKDMLVNFYRISGIRVGIHDLNMDIIVDYPHQADAFEDWNFCEKGKKCSKLFSERCDKCDHAAYEYVHATQKSYVYECHMGFMEAVIPVIVGGEVLCFLMIGQVRKISEETQDPEQIENKLRQYRFSETRFPFEQVLDHYRRTLYMHEETFRSFVYFLEICAQKIYNDSYIYIQRNKRSIPGELMKYINANLYNDLTVEDAARALNLSSSYLSHSIAKEMETTFTKYLNACRIEEAKRIMRVTDMNVKQIAALLRYTDTAYFAKQFKKVTGMTCTEYRRTVSNRNGSNGADR